MKRFIPLFLAALAIGCSSMPISERYIHSGTRAFCIHYGTTKISAQEPESGPSFFFTALTTGKLKEESTPAQKSYAYMYLAKIQLLKGNVAKATDLLDKAEIESNNLPYKYEILGDYFFEKENFAESTRYYKSLIKWIDNRIALVLIGSFDIDSLEFMDIRPYIGKEYQRDYLEMFNKKLPKKTRESIYIEYLTQKKKLAQHRILQTFTKNKN